MTFLAAAVGAVVGVSSANKASKSADAATAAQMAGFNQYKPYVDGALSGGEGALQGVLDTGNYQGQTLAGPNNFQTGTANNMGQYGQNMQGQGYNMAQANNNFGQNSQGLYDQFQGMSNAAANDDRMTTARDYATANSQPLIDSAMRNDARTLTESTLPQINMGASGSGNANSSRAGTAEAIARRGYGDRLADVTGDINQSLMTQSLGQQNTQYNQQGTALNSAGNANAGIQNAYGTGMDTLSAGGQFGMNAGNTLQGYDQAQLNDNQGRFEGNRDFGMNQYKDYMSGMLGKAPGSSQNVQPNLHNPLTSGVAGATAGYGFAQDNGYGNFIGNNPMFNNAFGGSGTLDGRSFK